MKVLMVSPEVVPFAKTGGLADVVGALPKYLAENGAETAVIMPLYRSVREKNIPMKQVGSEIKVQIGNQPRVGKVHAATMPNGKTPVYFVEMDHYYDRDQLYGTPMGDYKDNCERFVFFSRAVLEFIKGQKLNFDVLHCHDWQAALIPLYMRTLYSNYFQKTKALITVHNLAYQGTFWHWDMPLTGLDWRHFNWKELEFYGKLNFLKGGLVYADAITTVSKGYAREIQTEEFGCGLDGVLRERSDRLFGIINGVDYDDWSPATDKLIPAKYDHRSPAGKAECKKALQKKMRLDPAERTPLVAIIGRLAEQKGIDIIVEAMDDLMKEDMQLVVLGTGDAYYQERLKAIGTKYAGKISVTLAFDNKVAHEIEAGADMFLMPSRYEPCGLNQLYSLKYGTVPIVRSVGGLADSITDTTAKTTSDGTANGFSFTDYSAAALFKTVQRALQTYRNEPAWKKLVANGMKQDWSWNRSAKEYIELYCRI